MSSAVVGAVQAGGAAANGAIIERDSNANGEYVRFADGTQTCTGLVTLDGHVDRRELELPGCLRRRAKDDRGFALPDRELHQRTRRTPGNPTTNPSATGATIGF